MTDTSANSLENLAGRVKPRTASNLLLWGVAAFMIVFFVWAALTEIERTVRGTGRVIPTSQLQVLSNPEGGIVSAILVRAGDIVRAGQELVRLDATATGADLGSGEATTSALAVKIARLQAEVEGRTPVYPAAVDPSAAEQIGIERSLHASRMADLAAMIGAGQARLAQAERAVAESQAAYQARRTNADTRAAEAEMIRPLVERGIEPRLSLLQAESGAAVARSEAAAAAESISRARASVSEARAALAQMQQDWRARAAGELAAAQAELAARRRTLPALAERVERTVVRAPLPGRINRVLVTTQGGTVQPGQPILELVPSEDTLLIEARIRPQDIGTVRLGQEAKVGISAYDSSVYGRLDGEVVAISPDAVLDEQARESFYTVMVRTSRSALTTQEGRALPIGPGMQADVSLLGESRTVLQYILTPITRLSQSAFRE
jgi:membrane fusion protein, adhesin transport system